MKVKIPLQRHQYGERYRNGDINFRLNLWEVPGYRHDCSAGTSHLNNIELSGSGKLFLESLITPDKNIPKRSLWNIIIRTGKPEPGWDKVTYIGVDLKDDFLFEYGTDIFCLCRSGIEKTSSRLFDLLDTSDADLIFYVKLERRNDTPVNLPQNEAQE